MKLYKHRDYNEYVEAQIDKNVRKINLVWMNITEVNLLVEHIKKNIPNAEFGICHGVRNAWEVQQLRKNLNIEVIGTEISYTATQFENTIQWDFHNVKDVWIDNVDFIYSNSFDHSYDPETCLDRWMSCIKKDGICYIHWNHSNSLPKALDAADCFNATKDDYKRLFNKKYVIVDEFAHTNRTIFAIRHRK